MKTLLIINANLGQARIYMARTLLDATVRRAKLEIIDSPNNVEMTIVSGDSIPNNSALSGKNVWPGDVSRVVAHPELFLSEAKGHAKPYTVPVAATIPATASNPKRVAAVTACLTGIAYTFMAAEAIETEAKKRGWWVKVKVCGSVGVGNAITPKEVAAADLVIVAADIKMDLAKLTGKPMYRTSAGLALKETVQELDGAVARATPYEPAGKAQMATTESKRKSAGAYRHLLTGISYILPMVVADGLCIALSLAFSIEVFREPGTLTAALMQIGGGSAFVLMVPALVGHIVFSIADRPGLASDLIGDMLAVSIGSGFTGSITADFLTGYTAKLINTQLELPQSMEVLKPILIIPLISSLVVGLTMIYLIGKPVADVLEGLIRWLQTMGTADAVLLGAILGGMMRTDISGLINKATHAFGVSLLSTQAYGPMAAIMATSMIPLLTTGLTTMATRYKFDKAQQEGGKAVLVLGLCFISEGAIPFTAHDPMCVLPCCTAGGALTGTISATIGVKLMALYGGPFVPLVPGAITSVLGYLITIIVGALVAGLAYTSLKRPEADTVAKAAQ